MPRTSFVSVGFPVVFVLLGAFCGQGHAEPPDASRQQRLGGARPGDGRPPEADSIDRNYADELPRIPPLSPEKALESFTVAPGFRIELVAAEPLVTDPIAMAFDEQARLFVVEMRDYSEDGDLHLGRIRMLEDTDQDGRYDQSTIFVDGLSWPTAVACWDGGLFVGAPPDLWYFKDTTGDGRADSKRKVFTGFDRSNVQGMMNTLTWALDNRIHGATSAGAVLHRIGDGIHGTADPGAPDPVGPASGPPDSASGGLNLRGRDFALEPRSLQIEPTSGGAQHGLSFNRWGEKFVCSNSDHLQFVMFEDRYVARNPYVAAPGARTSIAADGPQAAVFRASPVEPWRILRTRLRVKGVVPGPVEGGGTPAGYFTGATGATVYRGNGWPETSHEWAIVADVGSNLVHRKRLERRGVGYVGLRVDEQTEFLTSRDIWFRPVQFASGPDGALYIADMYREVIEHPASLHPVIKQHLDLTSGRDRGRIYRVVSDEFQQHPLPNLATATIAQLVAALGHPNGWHRDTAARLIYERQDPRVIPALEAALTSPTSPEGRIQMLYALSGLSALSPEVLLPHLEDSHPQVRRHTIRLSERLAAGSTELRAKLVELTEDSDPCVRYQLAFSLGELPSDSSRHRALAAILRRDAGDPYVRLAVQSSLVEGAGMVLAELAADPALRSAGHSQEVIRSLARQIGKQRRPDDVALVLETLRRVAPDTGLLQEVVQGLDARPGSALEQQIASATGGKAAEVIQQMVSDAAQVARDGNRPMAERADAARLLRLGRFEELRETFVGLLGPAEPADLQVAALGAITAWDVPEAAAMLIERWPSFSPQLRSQAGDALFSRAAWLAMLLDAVEQKQIPLSDIEPGRLKLLLTHPDAGIRERASVLLAQTNLRGRSDVVAAYRDALQNPGDLARGSEVFKKVCAACHRLEGVGHEIGPNLASLRNRGPEAVLLNVLDPNREVNPQYLNYALTTEDGRSLSGMIVEETATSVTLKRAENASDTVLRLDIAELRSSGLSLMPEGLEKQIDQQALADLIAYLQSL